MKDREFILRATALYHDRDAYERPMTTFLNTFLRRHREFDAGIPREVVSDLFLRSIHAIHSGVGSGAFRPKGRLNTAVFDAVMVGVTTRLAEGDISDGDGLKAKYDTLLGNDEFLVTTDRTTTVRSVVLRRIDMGIEAFRDAS
jgi:hypothetical protein